ncbi:hypothetical protein NFI96_009241, partial [Prochilodus magdalenae]
PCKASLVQKAFSGGHSHTALRADHLNYRWCGSIILSCVFSLHRYPTNEFEWGPARSVQDSIVYTQDQLLALHDTAVHPWEQPVLPYIIMGNVRSLPNKMDELTALARHEREFHEYSAMLFTETWLTTLTPDTLVSLDGFHLIWAGLGRVLTAGGKTSGVVPVPKTPNPKDLNSYRPVALTSHLMKTLERLLLVHLRPLDSQSDRVVCSTGAPQGIVLAPFLFTLYTVDFKYSSASCHLQKFSDDSAIVGLISNGNDREYRELTKDFVKWCQRNCLQINAGKTKELVVDFRRAKHSPPLLVNIQGTDIEIVRSYKYLGAHLNNKLDWTDNTAALYRKGQSRLHLLRRLRSFGVQGALLRTFYHAVVASAIFYGVVCWGSSISNADRKRLNRVIKSSSVLGCPSDSVEVVGDRRMRTKFKHMLENLSHPMYNSVKALGSSFSARLLHP